jgi:hypothetical protein
MRQEKCLASAGRIGAVRLRWGKKEEEEEVK